MIRQSTLNRFRRDLEARGLRPGTVDAYERCVRRFLEQLERPASRAREQDVRDYVVGLRSEYSVRTVNQTIAALSCFYRETLRCAGVMARVRRMRVKRQGLPNPWRATISPRDYWVRWVTRHQAGVFSARARRGRLAE